MKKTLLLAGVACLFATQAMAFNVNPYVSAKLKYSMMDNSWKSSEADRLVNEEVYNFEETIDVDDKVFGGSIALGLKAPLNYGALRTEIEYSHNGDAKKSHTDEEGDKFETKLESQAVLFNAYYDFDTHTAFTPYVGGGLGFARLKGSVKWDEFPEDNGNMKNTNFAWQLGAGVAYNINEHVALDLGYRYIDYGDFDKSSSYGYDWGTLEKKDKIESKAHEIMLGLRYTF